MAIIKRKISPRQKMINLMYVVLMAMLALNISTEVLNGFSIVEESLNRTTGNSSMENNMIYGELSDMMKNNPDKVREWFEMATAVKNSSDSLFNYAQDLKVMIVREADGDDGDPLHIKNKDDLEAADQVMLSPTKVRARSYIMPSTTTATTYSSLLPTPPNGRLSPATCRPMCRKVRTPLASHGRNTCLRTCPVLLP